MNLNEAADIWRGVKYGNFQDISDARTILSNTMISELAPTPITEEWLRENGWEVCKDNSGHRKLVGECHVYVRNFMNDLWQVSFYTAWSPSVGRAMVLVKTLGELRTLMRLMGGGE